MWTFPLVGGYRIGGKCENESPSYHRMATNQVWVSLGGVIQETRGKTKQKLPPVSLRLRQNTAMYFVKGFE